MRSRDDAPANFGSQVAMKGGLPPDLQVRIEKIERGEPPA
jgi:hypothetical protein